MGRYNTKLACNLSLVMLLLGVFSATAFAHPSDGYTPGDPPRGYGSATYGLSPELNYGDLTFTRPYPAPDSLTNREKYYVFGTTSGPKGYPLDAYYRDVMSRVYSLYNYTGSVPPVLTQAAIAASYGRPLEQMDNMYLEMLRSPFTGDYPVLNAASFSPGQFYVRVLTDDEIKHFCQYITPLKTLYYNNEIQDPIKGDWQPAKLLGPIMYVRVYGESQVIKATLYYAYH
jgi:hypothetical protein